MVRSAPRPTRSHAFIAVAVVAWALIVWWLPASGRPSVTLERGLLVLFGLAPVLGVIAGAWPRGLPGAIGRLAVHHAMLGGLYALAIHRWTPRGEAVCAGSAGTFEAWPMIGVVSLVPLLAAFCLTRLGVRAARRIRAAARPARG